MLIQTEPTNLGYLLLDHRNSPELPPGVKSQVAEYSTYTCTHCQRVVIMNPERQRARAYCQGCSHLICDNCGAARAAGAKCKTMKQIVDELLESVERQKQSGSELILIP